MKPHFCIFGIIAFYIFLSTPVQAGSLLGFLGALGQSMGVGDSQTPNALERLNNNADPQAYAQRQLEFAQVKQLQQENATKQSALATLENCLKNNKNDTSKCKDSYSLYMATLQSAKPKVKLEHEIGLSEPNTVNQHKVFPASDCIGAVVNGICHGSVIDTGQGMTCHGEMLDGKCTGPLF